MKRVLPVLAGLLAAVVLAGGAASAREASTDKTLSPYFFVKSDDPTDQLPLKSTSAEVHIAGVIADVRVAQVYRNEGKQPIEALYVFPASTRAGVYGMKMTLGGRVIEAKIDKREAARRQYEDARDQGRVASLLEQQRPNVFQMNVANIMPGEDVKVDLRYTEALVPTDRVYEFVYPTVVGPRYSNEAVATAPASEQWVSNPYLHAGEAAPYRFDISVSLNAGMPIKELRSPSHKIDARYDGPATATVTLDGTEQTGGNRDYVLRYRLGGDRIESGLLLYEGEQEKFFLLMLEPPKRITGALIPGREYVFVVDVSGSMHGFPLEISKKLLRDLIGGLKPTDRFNVLLFSGGSSVMAPESVPASAENIQRAIQTIERQVGGGGTELLPALRRAVNLPKAEGYARTVVIATDGYVHVEEQAFDLIRNSLGKSNVFAFGIGTAVNRHLIEGMARVGMGEPFVITKPEEAVAQAARFRKMVEAPVLTDIHVDFRGFDAYDVEPAAIPDVMAERPVMVFGKWRGEARGTIALRGHSGSGPYAETEEVNGSRASRDNAALRYLWARQRIGLLSDYNRLRMDDRRVKEVTDLGLKYGLLTAYTSFVAVDTDVVNRTGQQATVRQPLPLPQGVSDYAVGGVAAATAPAVRMVAPRSGALMLDRSAPATPAPSASQEVRRDNLKEKEAGREKKSSAVTRVSGLDGVAREEVLAAVAKQIHAMEKCGAGRGQMVLELTIGGDGKVTAVKVVTSSLKDDPTACVAAQVKTAVFHLLPAATAAKATITLTFS